MNLRNLQESHLKTIYATYHTNLASGFRRIFFKVFYNDYIRKTGPAPGSHVFIDIIMNFRNLQEGHLRTIPAKYQYNLTSGFRGEDFLNFSIKII